MTVRQRRALKSKAPWLVRLAVAASALVLPALAGLSAPIAYADSATVQSTGDLLNQVRQLIHAKRYDEARAAVAGWKPSDATYKYRVAYVEGIIQQDQQNYDAAIATYRNILAEEPGFTGVRYDLTQTLFLAGYDDQAKYNAELLIAAGVDDNAGGGLKNIVGAIDDRRPIRFRSFASVLPSSNINQGTDNRIIVINGLPFVIGNASRRMSGVGMLVGGEVLFRKSFTKDVALIGSVTVAGSFYPAIQRSDYSFAANAGIEKSFDRAKLTVVAVGEMQLAGKIPAFQAYGGKVEYSQFFGENKRLYTSLKVTRRDFIGSTFRDGWRTDFDAFVDTFLKPNQFIRVLGGFVHESTNTPMFSYSEALGGLGFYTEAPWGLTFYVQGTYANRRYQGKMPFFGVPREDNRFDGQITVTKRDLSFMGVAPQLTYSVTKNMSNSVFDEYTSHGIDFKLVKEF